MHAIERLEDRIAPAAGLTVNHLPGGALSMVGTDGNDGVYFRSDEPGWLKIAVASGDLVLDNVSHASGTVTIPMPKGAIAVNLLGGSDGLFIGYFDSTYPANVTGDTIVIPGSLSISDSGGGSLVSLKNAVVRGNLSITGSNDSDTVYLNGRVAVGKNFTAEMGSGTFDLLANDYGAADISVGGSFRFHSTAPQATLALGLNTNGSFYRPGDSDPNVPIALALRQFKVGGNFSFEAASSDARMLLGGASLRIGGTMSTLATAADSNLFARVISTGALAIGKGAVFTSGNSSSVEFDAQQMTIAGSISLTGGAGNDELFIYGGTVMRLPKITLNYSAGDSNTYIAGQDPWSMAGALTITADTGTDFLGLRGPGKVTGTLSAAFGGGSADVFIAGDGAGRFNLLGPVKLTCATQIDVAMVSTNLLQRLDVGGPGLAGPSGNDTLAFDGVKAMNAVVFKAGAGDDGFYVEDSANGGFTPGAFYGPVLVDFGDGTNDTALLGNSADSGKATFFGTVTFKGLLGENYTAQTESPANIVFKKQPVIS